MKIDRLIGILSLLLQKDRMTTAELAEKFEVSRRTIIRDIEDICKAGIPIVTAKGKGGGVGIMEGFRFDRTLLSSEDMDTIMAGLRGLDSISGDSRYRQLMDKLSADNSEYLTAGNIIIDLSAWDKSAVSEKISLIKNAIDRDEKISFSYISPDNESRRVIEPYHLIYQWSSWYVWGWCCMRQDYRMFRLTRISELSLTGERREKRDVPQYVPDKLRHTKGEIEAVVKFDSSVKWRLADEFGSDMIKPDSSGNITLTFTWSDVPSFYRYILTFGTAAEIISPAEYRKGFGEIAAQTAEKYRED